jgi:cellulase (glycosyl hydrolase family 5)
VATWNGSMTPDGPGRLSGWLSSWRRSGWPRSGWPPSRWPAGWQRLVRGAALVLAPLVVVALLLPLGEGGGSIAAKAAACGKAVGPFTAHGTKVLGGDGSVFISYGMSVSGLQEGNWTGLVTGDMEKIAAIANDWCANTVRIQVNQDLLLGPHGTSWDPEYMAAIESEVNLAESYKMVVVLNDETNFAPLNVRHYQAGPTPGTLTFWKDMTKIYGNDPQMIFDLYNEPRTSVPYMPDSTLWRLWLNGGTFKHTHYTFGMAYLAHYVRYTAGAKNLFWIEGPRYSLSFEGMIRYHALIHVSNIAYSVHHAQGAHNEQAWYSAFGYLVVDGIAPVVDGEFTNYEPHPNPAIDLIPGYCWYDAPITVPKFLAYLTRLGIGMNAYQLVPGWLITSDKRLGSPTSMNPKTWSCQPDRETQPGQSAGALILQYFQQQNSS